MYLTSLNAKQTGEANGLTCPVLIEWSFGDLLPNVVEIYADGAPIDQLKVKSSKDPTSITVSLPAGTVIKVSVCPRLVKDDTLLDQMPNAQGVNQYWESFCLFQNITTKAKPGTGEVTPKPPPPAPTITTVEAVPASVIFLRTLLPTIIKLKGGVRVSWISSYDFSSFLVLYRWDSKDFGPRTGQQGVDEGGKSGSFVLRAVTPGLEYELSVKGRDSGLLSLFPTYSNWASPVKIVAQKNLSSLQQYLRISGLDGTSGIRQYLFADAGSLRSFMQIQ
jgi:hypothetical protein